MSLAILLLIFLLTHDFTSQVSTLSPLKFWLVKGTFWGLELTPLALTQAIQRNSLHTRSLPRDKCTCWKMWQIFICCPHKVFVSTSSHLKWMLAQDLQLE